MNHQKITNNFIDWTLPASMCGIVVGVLFFWGGGGTKTILSNLESALFETSLVFSAFCRIEESCKFKTEIHNDQQGEKIQVFLNCCGSWESIQDNQKSAINCKWVFVALKAIVSAFPNNNNNNNKTFSTENLPSAFMHLGKSSNIPGKSEGLQVQLGPFASHIHRLLFNGFPNRD